MDWTFPYPSRRSPIFANNVVATSHPLASESGLEMLRRGGNAVDAALASAISLTILEPCSNGLGSDAFALVWDGRELHGLNGSGRSPQTWTADKFKDPEKFATGWDSVTVPGAVDAWVELSNRFGRLPFADLFVPARRYAQSGFCISPIIQASWAEQAREFAQYDGFRDMFMPNGRSPEVGEIVTASDQASTLDAIAHSKGEEFYRGDLARKMSDYLQDNGGSLAADDLAVHRSRWVKPITCDYQGVTACEIPPNGQGIAVLIALGILKHLELERFPLDSVDSFHLQIEVMRMALGITIREVADPAHMRVTVDALLDDEFLKRHADAVDLNRAAQPDLDLPANGGTVYLTAADEQGMMVSFIQSNFSGFGSGIVVPGTGISLQNRAAGFSPDSTHPNAVGGHKLPFHTIIPGFVMRDGKPLMGFGVMGGNMQAQGHLQMITRMFVYDQNPQTASDAPRWFVDGFGCVRLETGFSHTVAQGLWDRGHRPAEDAPHFGFGGAQLIYRLDNGVYCAASDHRKDGQAVGF